MKKIMDENVYPMYAKEVNAFESIRESIASCDDKSASKFAAIFEMAKVTEENILNSPDVKVGASGKNDSSLNKDSGGKSGGSCDSEKKKRKPKLKNILLNPEIHYGNIILLYETI